ncbi:MAG: FixH family protein [Acidobacteria bacterium]|nr:FixH family protein [Acidobacteriota bacterium]
MSGGGRKAGRGATVRSILRVISEYRWPIYLGGLLAMSVAACGVLVWVATRPDSPRPISGYYEAARAWDADEAVEAASRELGWSVRYELPADIPHYTGMPRPVDVRVADRDARPVSGLVGRLLAVRPSDTRLNQDGQLTELPQQPGTYRVLVRLDEPGTWELRIDTRQQGLRFVHGARVEVRADAALPAGRAR